MAVRIADTASSAPFKMFSPFPTMYLCQLRTTYGAALASDGTTGTLGGTAFTIQPTSIHTPIVGSGVHPYSSTPMATLYGKYKVLGWKLCLDLNAQVANTGQIVQNLTQPPSGTFNFAGVSLVLSASHSACDTIFVDINRIHYERSYKAHEVLGVTKKEFDADVEEYAALVGADPVQMPTHKLYTADVTSGTPNSIGCMITLIQTVQYFGVTQQANA